MVLCSIFKNEFQECYSEVDLSSFGPLFCDCGLPYTWLHCYQEVMVFGGLGLEGSSVSS